MRVLVLGGTSEATALAALLAEDPALSGTLSLAGVTRAPVLPRIAHRIGGFGGAGGLADWLRADRTGALVDATHPYALRISRHAALATAAVGIPLLRIERPAWTAQAGDRWVRVDTLEAAAAALGPAPRRVLLTVGSKGLAPFRQQGTHRYLVRCIDPPDPDRLPDGATLLLARGPFTLEGEMALLGEYRIERLVSKNSGGEATAPKLEAARRLGVTVVMIDRPAGTAGATDVPGAMQWLGRVRRGQGAALDPLVP